MPLPLARPPYWLTCLLSVMLCSFVTGHAEEQQPKPLFAPGEHILFQGDSITDMGRGRGEDPNHILGHGYAFLIAARHGAAFPERTLTFINRGISGNTIADLEARWKTDTLDNKPEVLSVLIGINDIYFSFKNGIPLDIPALEAAYDRLLNAAQTQNPALKIILGEPFILPGGHNQGNWKAWQKAVAEMQALTARVASKHGAVVVHYQDVFNKALKRAPASYWIWDGIHPTYSGHALMAEAWQRSYESLVRAREIPAHKQQGS